MLIVRHAEVRDVLVGREMELIGLVRDSYRLHDEGRSAVPHSSFLRFPGNRRNRIIALPAFIGGSSAAVGIKWIASFPDNIKAGLARASATILLNSLDNGRPEAMIEGSLISAKRTAASAALAAGLLDDDAEQRGVSLIGCGVINLEVLRFLAAAMPGLREVTLFDTDPARTADFAHRCAEIAPRVNVTVTVDGARAMAAQRLISVATTSSEPYLDLAGCELGTVVLHLSLRDLLPTAILASQNVVDDADHVCREGTSLHLAERITGDRSFVHASIGQLVRGRSAFRRDPDKVLVFSPFGLGVLDIALAEFVRAAAQRRNLGVHIDDFLPMDDEHVTADPTTRSAHA